MTHLTKRKQSSSKKKMLSIFTIKTLVFSSVLTLPLAFSSPCTFIAPCACSTDDYTIDLKPLMSLRKDSEFYVKGNGYQFYLHPCNRSPKACNNSQMTGCQIGSAVSNIFGIGHIDGNSMYGGPDTGNLTIKNDYVGDDKSIRISWLNVVCRDVEANFTYENESPLQTYIFTLYTRYGCLPSNDKSGGLSVGSVLVILFFVLLLIYLVGGVLFLKYVRKAEGIEVIPNVEFWKDLPSLIKDGILFTFRGCKTETTYEKI